MSISPARLEEWLATTNAATPGPWKVWAMDVMADPGGRSNLDDAQLVARTSDSVRGLNTSNADFMCTARAAMPTLLAEVIAQRGYMSQLAAQCHSLAHQRDRLPTQWAYDQVCLVMHKAKAERDALQVEVDRLIAAIKMPTVPVVDFTQVNALRARIEDAAGYIAKTIDNCENLADDTRWDNNEVLELMQDIVNTLYGDPPTESKRSGAGE